MAKTVYTGEKYLEDNPTWHIEDSYWKANQIIRIIQNNHIRPKTICDIGCGSGGVLSELQKRMSDECQFYGYDISPNAIEVCRQKINDRFHCFLKDFLDEKNKFFDIIMLIDVIEHLENYIEYLRKIKEMSHYKILHIPLDLSVNTIIRTKPIVQMRKQVGHIHYFTKEIILALLDELGYGILDHFYTAGSVDLPPKSIKMSFAKIPRRCLFLLNKDLAVRFLGGYSMMILAK